jgi:hypothetical protein
MSDTPRTDAYRSITAPKAEDNWAAFARILERELATVTAERDRLKDCMRKIHLAAQNSGTRVSDLEKESRKALRGEVQP